MNKNKVNYFEVLYTNCFNEKMVALVATTHDTPNIPTANFNFDWNGNRFLEYRETTQQCYRTNTFCFYKILKGV